ncbi:hypothetical protein FNH22_23880 [Fulvivirga sp. M361]|uniref:DUF6452 family protein n=1 Tax=Fulvivirga sp. M361 TaxID=2594266 RepID=UPI00117B50BE|nr:DUF6452 family protein [Fulvivirga sp. M361]TRX51604.1 hypothetical protein FNH22_23880 [Fulvivirga sp. M361]
MKNTVIALFFAGCIGLISCLDDPDCVRSTTDFVNLKFYQSEGGGQDTVDIERIVVLGSDSVLLADTTFFSTVFLPVNVLTDSVTFVFQTEFGIDTLALTYNSSSRLISEDCGVEVLFSNLREGRNDFDSLVVVNNTLIEAIDEDIRIFH